MVYGLQIKTQNGMKSIGEIISTCRFVGAILISTASGSAPLPSGWTPENGVYIPLMKSSSFDYQRFSISGGNLVWTNGGSANARVLFFITTQTTMGSGYGFVAKNDNGIVVIDDNYKAMSVRSRGTSAASQTLTAQGITNYVHDIPASEGDVIAVSWNVGDIVGSWSYKPAGTRTILSNRSTINYVICDPEYAMPKSDWGLEIYNAAGTRVYDSGAEILDVAAVRALMLEQVVAGQTCPSTVNYAFCSGSMAMYQETSIGGGGNGFYPTYFYTAGLHRTSPTTYQQHILYGSLSYLPGVPGNSLSNTPVHHMLLSA